MGGAIAASDKEALIYVGAGSIGPVADLHSVKPQRGVLQMRTVTGKCLGTCTALLFIACQRSPYTIARRVSELAVPNAPVVRFIDESSGAFGQDLDTEVELVLTPQQTVALIQEALARGYVRSVKDSLGAQSDTINALGLSQHGWPEVAEVLSPNAVGYYRYQRESESSYTLAVIDSTANRLRIRVEIL